MYALLFCLSCVCLLPLSIWHLALSWGSLDNCPAARSYCLPLLLLAFSFLFRAANQIFMHWLYPSFSLLLHKSCHSLPTRRMRNFHKWFKYLMPAPKRTQLKALTLYHCPQTRPKAPLFLSLSLPLSYSVSSPLLLCSRALFDRFVCLFFACFSHLALLKKKNHWTFVSLPSSRVHRRRRHSICSRFEQKVNVL